MRKGTFSRKTRETDINISLNLDGEGQCSINTGIGFFDHMLELFAVHGGFDLEVSCAGDLKVDGHHTVEDIGICLGKLIAELAGDKCGIARYAAEYVPMDESLARAVADVSGRPFLVFDADLSGKAGDFDLALAEEFFRAVATNAMITLHISLLYGKNPHHIAEAIFKAFARALRNALRVVSGKIPSSKGVL